MPPSPDTPVRGTDTPIFKVSPPPVAAPPPEDEEPLPELEPEPELEPDPELDVLLLHATKENTSAKANRIANILFVIFFSYPYLLYLTARQSAAQLADR